MSHAQLIAAGVSGLALMSFASAWAFLLRRGAASARQRIWQLAFSALLASSVLSFVPWYPKLPAPSLPPHSSIMRAGVAPPPPASVASPQPASLVAPQPPAVPLASRSQRSSAFFPTADALLALWLLGAALLLARSALGLARAARWASRAQSIDRHTDALGQKLAELLPASVDVRMHPDCVLPVTVGLFQPAVILPLESRNWDQARLRIVLLHELAHLRRRDPLHRAIAELATALHWPNPLTWVGRTRLRLEQERAADDAVLLSGVRPATYAGVLMALADAVRPLLPRMPAVISMAERTGLVGRIENILASGRVRSDSPRFAVGATVAFCAAALALAGLPFAPARATVASTVPVATGTPGPRIISCDALGSIKAPPPSTQKKTLHWWNDTPGPISIATFDSHGQLQTKDAPIVDPGRGRTIWDDDGQVGVALDSAGRCIGAAAYTLGDSDVVIGPSGPVSGKRSQERIAAIAAGQDRYTERASCDDLGSLKSPGGGLSRTIRFWNDTDRAISIDWINDSGKRKFNLSLAPGAVKDWSTQDWHLFVATASDGRCLGVASVPRDGQDVVYTTHGALHGAERDARLDALAVSKAAASETRLASCRATVADEGAADPGKLIACRRILRELAGAYELPVIPEAAVLGTGYSDDFQRPELGPSYFASSARWRILDGEVGSSYAKNRPLWLNVALPNDVQIEFDARSEGSEGDVKCELFGDGFSHASGYVLILAGWGNSLTVLTRLNEHAPAVGRFADGLTPTGWARVERRDLRVEPGRKYHWLVRRQGATILWQIDGKTVFEETDPQPLAGPGHDRFGFAGWDAEVRFDNLKIVPL
jgi:beta-lactamase regulating signal transducer with metallopeptidase domain